MSSDVNTFHFRLVLLGSNKTGKTSILNRFLFKKFEIKYKPTVEDLFSKDFDLGSIEIKVDFLDTSGSMQFPAMRRLSITTGDAFLIVYALDDESSYEAAKMYVGEILECRPDDFQEIPIVFAGNKSDLARERRSVPKELVSNYVHYELPRLRAKVIECSCKENQNIDSIFRAYLSLARVRHAVSVGPRTAAGDKHAQRKQSQRGVSGASSRAQTPTSNSFSGRHSVSRQRPSSAAAGGSQDSCTSSKCSSPRERITAHLDEETRESSCATSIKMVLGVRKSCDASIVSSMRKVSLSGGGSARNSREHLLLEETDGRRAVRRQQPRAAESPTQILAADDNRANHNNQPMDHKHTGTPETGDRERNREQEREQKLELGQELRLQQRDNDVGQCYSFVENCQLESGGSAERQLYSKASIESILKDAQQNHHSNRSKKFSSSSGPDGSARGANHAKPRSRSLIWRPHRKSSRNSGQDSSECRIN